MSRCKIVLLFDLFIVRVYQVCVCISYGLILLYSLCVPGFVLYPPLCCRFNVTVTNKYKIRDVVVIIHILKWCDYNLQVIDDKIWNQDNDETCQYIHKPPCSIIFVLLYNYRFFLNIRIVIDCTTIICKHYWKWWDLSR